MTMVLSVEEKFTYDSEKNHYICKICNKIYKNIYKNDNKTLKKFANTHRKINCKPKKTRNIKAYGKEKDCYINYQKKYGEDNVIKPRDNLFIRDKITKKMMNNEYPKTDIYIKNLDRRIQFKNTKYVYVHNWTKTTHLDYIKKEWGIDLKPRLISMILSEEESLKNKLVNGDNRRNMVKICINVKIIKDDKKITNKKLLINDLKLKKIFIHWDKNTKNNFYYVYGDDIDKMILMDDKEIDKLCMVFDLRTIYSNSGETNLGMQDIFINDKEIQTMIKRINKKNRSKRIENEILDDTRPKPKKHQTPPVINNKK
jgi:hypothetical protein